jgi:uncharacterized protein (TIGR00730 family)
MKSVCVFCGSSRTVPKIFFLSALNMGSALGKRNLELVFGGAGVGLMKALADGAIDSGGRIVGVMPRAWAPKRAHPNITRLELVDSIQERKRRMLSMSDAFLALPGGFGTLDEFTEVLTLAQLGVHHKPCAILNVNGYFDVFLNFLDEMNTYGFIDSSDKNAIIVEHEPDRILDIMATKAGSPP